MRKLLSCLLILSISSNSWAAIAKDGATDCNPGASSTYTCVHVVTSNTNGILLVSFFVVANSDNSVPTYNGTSMTLLTSASDTNGDNAYLYYLLNPSTGSNTLSVADGQRTLVWMEAASYTGVTQSAPTVYFVIDIGNNTSYNISNNITPTVNNSWVWSALENVTASGPVIYAGTALINTYSSGTNYSFNGDTGNIATAATKTVGVAGDSSGFVQFIADAIFSSVALAPAAVAASIPNPRRIIISQ